ncbi:MAG: hypothetical protein ACXW18_14075, partial [Pyrinomonadaceae bacterium]
MKRQNPTFVFLSIASILALVWFLSSDRDARSQTRERRVNSNSETIDQKGPDGPVAEIVKVDVDLVRVDALVLQKDTARIVGGLTKENFLLFEDGAKQEITHFSQDSLPLSVILLIDRGGCLDPFANEVRRAAREAIDRLKPTDEVAVMAYHDTTMMVQRFTRNRILLEESLGRVPPHV